LNKSPGYRRHAALQILAMATAIARICALPDTDSGRLVDSTNFQFRILKKQELTARFMQSFQI
jgi:hypothetical protein